MQKAVEYCPSAPAIVTKIKNMTSPRIKVPNATVEVQQAESVLGADVEAGLEVVGVPVPPNKVLFKNVFVLKSDASTRIAIRAMGTVISKNINMAWQK